MKRTFIFLFVILLLTSCQRIKYTAEPASSGSAVSTVTVSQPENRFSSVPEKTSSVAKAVSSATESKTSSSQSTVSSEESKPELTASIKISGIDVVIYEKSAVVITENMTVYDFTKKVCTDNNIVFKSEPGYIKRIGDFEEFKPTVQSGWIFKLNGVKSAYGCGSVKLKGDEKIEWVFTTNYGKDVG